jgi:hypothetical protein
MATDLTLYTRDKHWKVEIAARTNDLHFYRSIGTHVTIYHRERITSIWGGIEREWEELPALVIRIHNVYSGAGPVVSTREHECRNRSQARLEEWSTGGPIHLRPDYSISGEVRADLDINKVEGTVTVVVGDETLTGLVSASGVEIEGTVSAAA